MTIYEYIAEVQRQCAFYGFPSCPLNNAQIIECRTQRLTIDQTYGVACDVFCGWTFAEAMLAGA